MELRYCLNQGILERISKILGDTSHRFSDFNKVKIRID